jgi:protein Mpv17
MTGGGILFQFLYSERSMLSRAARVAATGGGVGLGAVVVSRCMGRAGAAPTRSASSSAPGNGGVLAWYGEMLRTHPVATKIVTSGLVGGFGDALSQVAIEKLPVFDWARFGRFCATSSLLVGGGLHVWYGSLERIVTASGTKGIVLRTLLDQFAFAPPFIFLVLTTLGVLVTGDVKRSVDETSAKWPHAVVTNWGLWIPAQLINFAFIPLHYRVLFSNFVGVVWSAFLSHLNASSQAKTAAAHAEAHTPTDRA